MTGCRSASPGIRRERTDTAEGCRRKSYVSPLVPWTATPILIECDPDLSSNAFAQRPLWSVLLFPNTDSDARDHCANERTFLSWLRLAVYTAVVAVAIVVSFHVKSKPTKLELRMALPLGLIFWFLSLLCLASGLANYIRTVNRYSSRRAIVQSGWKTQVVFTIVAVTIIASCVLFLSTGAAT